MANDYFAFKQFTVYHDKCAMKVGTDGVLLGLLANISRIEQREDVKVLDIGTGTGLVALIAAQRLAHAEVTAIEIEPNSAMQARENFVASPFASRLKVVQGRVQDYSTDIKFDLILCNPPFYNGTLTSPDDKRTLARHALSLTFDELAQSASRLLAEEGQFVVVIPSYAEGQLTDCCTKYGLYLNEETKVYPNINKEFKRVVVQYSRIKTELAESKLLIDDPPGYKSAQFKELVKEYYIGPLK